LAAPSHGVGLAKSDPTPASEEEATGVSETTFHDRARGKKTPSRDARTVVEVGIAL